MTLNDALMAATVSPGGYRTALRGDYTAIQDTEGRVSITRVHNSKEGYGCQLRVMPAQWLRSATDWQPFISRETPGGGEGVGDE